MEEKDETFAVDRVGNHCRFLSCDGFYLLAVRGFREGRSSFRPHLDGELHPLLPRRGRPGGRASLQPVVPDDGVGGDRRPPFTLTPAQAGEVLAENVAEAAFQLSPYFPMEVLQWEELIVAGAQSFGLDPNLYAALIKKESWFPVDTWPQGFERCPDGPVTPSCTSKSGAIGIAQVMPFHFGPGEDGRDPRTNIFKGAEVLTEAFTIKNGDVRAALAAYNAGPYRETYPAESWAYADKILEWYREATTP